MDNLLFLFFISCLQDRNIRTLVKELISGSEYGSIDTKNVLIAVVLLLEKCYDIKKVGRPYSKVAMCVIFGRLPPNKKKK